MDLIIFYSRDKACMTYCINYAKPALRSSTHFLYIKNMYLKIGDAEMGNSGGLVVELNRPPNFFIDSSGSGTEDQQASAVMLHHLCGHPKVLSDQLANLVECM